MHNGYNNKTYNIKNQKQELNVTYNEYKIKYDFIINYIFIFYRGIPICTVSTENLQFTLRTVVLRILQIFITGSVYRNTLIKYKDIINYEVIFYLYSLYVTFNSYFYNFLYLNLYNTKSYNKYCSNYNCVIILQQCCCIITMFLQ